MNLGMVDSSRSCVPTSSSMNPFRFPRPDKVPFFFIQFNVPFKIISLIETSQSIGGAKREYPGKTT